MTRTSTPKPINLICLPFAGGNKYSYRIFSDKAPSNINIVTLEYPGRGSRIKEQLVSDMPTLINDLYKQVKDIVDTGAYAIYGHSMGGLMAYLLTLEIIKNNHQQPKHLFITGTTGPSSLSRSEKNRYLMGKEEFIEEIRNLNGMPDEILENIELLDYLEPILRADFKVSETYRHDDHAALNIPFTVITGKEEDMETSDILLWQKETIHQVDFKQMPGNHFFIFQHVDKIFDIIAKKLFYNLTLIDNG